MIESTLLKGFRVKGSMSLLGSQNSVELRLVRFIGFRFSFQVLEGEGSGSRVQGLGCSKQMETYSRHMYYSLNSLKGSI